ncbi:MAG: hypothetical protein EOO24_66735 [Comamonadaceae bacterium]|nr:MAG: hypothetical protein EOO24_66735 [Comamonadaceae bacterium]
MSPRTVLPVLAAAALAAGCAAPTSPGSGPGATPANAAGRGYHCDDGSRFRLVVDGDVARVDGLPDGPQRLARDAGGMTPSETVWTGERLRAEFGLGDAGDRARLHRLQPPATLSCAVD